MSQKLHAYSRTESSDTYSEDYQPQPLLYLPGRTLDGHPSSATQKSTRGSDNAENSRYSDPEECHCNDCVARKYITKTRTWITAEKDPDMCKNRRRTLVLCFDGTGDKFDNDNSNVVHILSALRKDDHNRQLVYYQAELGTYTDPVVTSAMASRLSKVLDMMFASNLASHVRDGYAFLMQNYTVGDKICMFGFSRGAYTARALAGMLYKVGLLPAGNIQQIPFAYDMYQREDEAMSKEFKQASCRSVHIDFLGVWDTVASVGLVPHHLPYVHENRAVRYLRHALALDERRVKFIPQFCTDPPSDTAVNNAKEQERNNNAEKRAYTSPMSDVEEVWFTGVHCDVGGGAVINEKTVKLSGIPLRWMIRECFKCNTRIVFDAAVLRKLGLPVYVSGETGNPILAPLYEVTSLPYPSPSQETPTPQDNLEILPADYELRRDLDDAHDDLHDMLKGSPMWNILEWLPLHLKKEKALASGAEGRDSYRWVWNRGKGRKIVKREIQEGWKVHRTVLLRLHADKDYVPQACPNIPIAKNPKTNRDKTREADVGRATKSLKDPRRLDHDEWRGLEWIIPQDGSAWTLVNPHKTKKGD